MSDMDNETLPETAALERKRAKLRGFKKWVKRLRILLALCAALLGVYIYVSYRIYTLPGDFNAESNKIQSPVEDVMPGDSVLLQNLNLWREPKVNDTVIYQREQAKEGVPETLIGRVVGLPGETLTRVGPTIKVGDRAPLQVGFDIGPDEPIKGGDVIPDGCYLIVTDSDAVGYADSRDLGYIPRDRVLKRVTFNLAPLLGQRQ